MIHCLPYIVAKVVTNDIRAIPSQKCGPHM